MDALNQNCKGKNGCNFNNKVHDYFTDSDDCWSKKIEQDLVVQLKCGNLPEVIAKRNTTGVISSSLGVLGNLLFIIGISYRLSRKNKIRGLKYAEYTVSSKNFSCELIFDDDHFDYLCYGQNEGGGSNDEGMGEEPPDGPP